MEWIKVEDKLPKVNEVVLTFTPDGYGNSIEWLVNETGWSVEPPPTHWMPLPPDPVGSSHGG
jgi:hypothetical protein